MTRPINAAGKTLLDNSEACRLYTYDDRTGRQVTAGGHASGRLTAGWGHTGADIVAGMTVTQDIADAWREEDRARAAAFVERVVTVKMTDNQFAALVDFAFNAGTGNFQRYVAPLVNRGDWRAVAAHLKLWVRSGGKIMPGLVLRREREITLLQTPDSAVPPAPPPVPVPSVMPDRPGLWARLLAWGRARA